MFHGILGSHFAVAGGLIDGSMESGREARVKGFHSFSAQAFARELNSMGLVGGAIQDGVGVGGISNGFMPVLDGELARDDCGAVARTILKDFQQIASL